MALGIEERFNVRDGARNITFLGWKLSEASSQTDESVRWTELTLYKTVSGNYVLAKVGCSDVFHSEDCERENKGKRHVNLDEAADQAGFSPDEELEYLFAPCPECKPDFDVSPVWVEKDLYSVVVHPTAEVAVNAMYQTKRDRPRSLSRIARKLLDDAAAKDKDVRKVYEEPVTVD
jgi:hypothetical protein